MTVKDLAYKYSFEVLSMPAPDLEVKGGYSGDLLSWVMGRAAENNAWITIMTNINIVAVASLSGVSVIVLSENVKPDSSVIETANEKGVNILCSKYNTYETSVLISEVL